MSWAVESGTCQSVKAVKYKRQFKLLKIDRIHLVWHFDSRKNIGVAWDCFRWELKLQNSFGSYLILGTTDKPEIVITWQYFVIMNLPNLIL